MITLCHFLPDGLLCSEFHVVDDVQNVTTRVVYLAAVPLLPAVPSDVVVMLSLTDACVVKSCD